MESQGVAMMEEVLSRHHPMILDILAVPYRVRYAALPEVAIREGTTQGPLYVAHLASLMNKTQDEFIAGEVYAALEWAIYEVGDRTGKWSPP